jgi:large subunit ribosomal protein L9
MKVTLLKDVKKVGKKFDICDVSDGYALNYLIPNRLAEISATGSAKQMEHLKKKDAEDKIARAEKVKEALSKLTDKIIINEKANEKGVLFSGIGKERIAKEIEKSSGAIIQEEDIMLDEPIKKVGEHALGIKVGEKTIEINLEVIPE